MAGRYPTDEHTSEDFEDYMRRARNPTGTSVGATECACGAKKGKDKWARVANGQPKETKFSECGNPNKWKREAGYTNKYRVALELFNRSCKKLKGMVKGLRAAMLVCRPRPASAPSASRTSTPLLPRSTLSSSPPIGRASAPTSATRRRR